MGPMMGAPVNNKKKSEKIPPPKSVREVPKYIGAILKKAVRAVADVVSRLVYIFKLVWETRPWILFAMLFFAIIEGIMPVVKALVAAEILNRLADAYVAATSGTPIDFDVILKPMILQFVLIFVSSIISTLDAMVNRISGELVVNTVKLKIMNKAKNVDLASFDDPEFYTKLENASREASMRPIGIINATFSQLCALISLVSFVVVLWGVSPWAPALIIALALPSAIVNFIYRRKNWSYMRYRSKDRRQLSYYSDVMTNKDLAKEIRMFGLSEFFTDKYKNTFKKYFAGLRKMFVGEGGWNALFAMLTAVVNCGLFLFIARGVVNGTSQVGDYSLYTGALNSISGGIRTIVSTTATIYEGTLFIDNLISFIKEPQRIIPTVKDAVKPERHVAHKIEFCDVSFRYPGSDHDTIKHFSATIDRGETVVLVGLNGAGKTTLIKLLTRLYDPTDGKILLDGRDIREYDTAALYKIYGIIFQDFGKYAVSVAENIAMSDTDAPIDMERVVRAAKEGSADAFIDALPKKYDTALMRYFEEDGKELSVGQWQKLSVARAFYSDSDILILDEPTAALDAIAEQEIYSQFDNLRRDKTTIFVSHRLSSATVADKILVVENGCLVEQGNHSELMKLGGKYAELFTAQAKRYMESEKEVNEYENSKEDRNEDRNTTLHAQKGGGRRP